VDLIAFDSPFVASQGEGTEDAQREWDFEGTWNSDNDLQQTARGWCDAPIEDVIQRLHGIDQHQVQVLPADTPPFVGMLRNLPGKARTHEIVHNR
jgi:hypothetical protein